MMTFNMSWMRINSDHRTSTNDLSLTEFRRIAGELLRDQGVSKDSIRVECFIDHKAVAYNMSEMMGELLASFQTKGVDGVDNIIYAQAMLMYFRVYLEEIIGERRQKGHFVPSLKMEHVRELPVSPEVRTVINDKMTEIESMTSEFKTREQDLYGIVNEEINNVTLA